MNYFQKWKWVCRFENSCFHFFLAPIVIYIYIYIYFCILTHREVQVVEISNVVLRQSFLQLLGSTCRNRTGEHAWTIPNTIGEGNVESRGAQLTTDDVLPNQELTTGTLKWVTMPWYGLRSEMASTSDVNRWGSIRMGRLMLHLMHEDLINIIFK